MCQGEMVFKDCDGNDLSLDGSLWDGSDDNLDNSSDLDREWQRRHDQFHTIGYRDGLIAGKEASAQEGFNIGFKQSVLTGYSWGVVRGVTSAFAYLPDQLKEKLVETLEKRNEFQGLYESVHSLSTTDALRLFNEDIKAKEPSEQSEHVEGKLMSSGSVRTGGKGTIRRKKVVHKTTTTDDKRLQSTLKRIGVNAIPAIEEVNIFKDDVVIQFLNPKVQATIAANTWVVSGSPQTKKLHDMLPSIIHQLGPDNFENMKKLAEQFQKQAPEAGAGATTTPEENDDDVPELAKSKIGWGMKMNSQSLHRGKD